LGRGGADASTDAREQRNVQRRAVEAHRGGAKAARRQNGKAAPTT